MDLGNTPRTSMLTTLWYADTKAGERTQVAYVQEIPTLKGVKNAITYSALDLDEKQQAKGIRPAETLTISILYTEKQHDKLKELADSDKDYYWFIKFPESTASEATKPLVFMFTGTCDLANDTIAIDDMLKENLTIYKSSKVEEMKGFPSE